MVLHVKFGNLNMNIHSEYVYSLCISLSSSYIFLFMLTVDFLFQCLGIIGWPHGAPMDINSLPWFKKTNERSYKCGLQKSWLMTPMTIPRSYLNDLDCNQEQILNTTVKLSRRNRKNRAREPYWFGQYCGSIFPICYFIAFLLCYSTWWIFFLI